MNMPTRNVVFTDRQSAFIDELVASGRYQNASEVLRAGMRLLERSEAEFEELRARLRQGLEDYRGGDFAEGDGRLTMRAIIDEFSDKATAAE
jgi:antitoxin ParD1/3/4